MTIGTVTLVATKSVSESSFVPINSSARYTAFHPDDFTHPCHPLYVHPSDTLGAYLVSIPFDSTCYGNWRRNILVALSVRNKLDFINRTTERPHVGSPFARQWQRCNDLVVSWLTNSLTKEISRSVEYSELAKDIWNELEERYGKADGARIFELKKDLAHTSQGSLDIASYFNKIKQLWDEIASIFVNHPSVLLVEEIKRLKRSKSILLSDEKQRQVSSASHFSSSSALFNVGVSQQNFHSKVSFDPPKPSLICKYCKKPGYTIEKCYKLHGFPPNFKFSKIACPRKMVANTEVDRSGLLGASGGSVDQPKSQSE
ncbi:uncharacterized protein LOC142168812 [Nicotiana tabacum]|uniref:Uncharacterized protein LOC142168812 n=1 Tax=Nicotiana tabacum TaxID=4097 RepID=A0AC58SM70_TOBAC